MLMWHFFEELEKSILLNLQGADKSILASYFIQTSKKVLSHLFYK